MGHKIKKTAWEQIYAEKARFRRKQENRISEALKIIFMRGNTYIGVAWLMLILGLIIGYFIGK